jgi:16S rRNA (uracil1498-N3)-methyltransferase
MTRHGVYFPDVILAVGEALTVTGEEAHHAVRVKRVEVGDDLRVHDGRGAVARARIEEVAKARGSWEVRARIAEVTRAPEPRLTVFAAAPKGDRLDAMIDGLSQVGAGSWRPLLAARIAVEPGGGRIARLDRIAAESMKQCGRAWLLRIGPPATLDGALAGPGPVVLAEASGAPFAGGPVLALLIGPEGGWEPAELARARAAGAALASFGPHTMRTETAAVVAAAALVSAGA